MFRIIPRLKPVEVSPSAAAADADTALSMQPSMRAYAAACTQAPMSQLPVAVFCLRALADATYNHMKLKCICVCGFTCALVCFLDLDKSTTCISCCKSTNEAACGAAENYKSLK